MPIDAVFLESLRCELQEQLLACRVDKVQQPERDTILLSMRGPNGGGKLLLTASPNHPRIQLTSLSFENPAQPPMFCMLLRKGRAAAGPAGALLPSSAHAGKTQPVGRLRGRAARAALRAEDAENGRFLFAGNLRRAFAASLPGACVCGVRAGRLGSFPADGRAARGCCRKALCRV